MGQLPERGDEGRAEAQLTLPVSGLAGKARSFLPLVTGSLPFSAQVRGRRGPASRRVNQREEASLRAPRQLLSWGYVCSESELPQDPAPEGVGVVGMQVSREHSAALESFFGAYPRLRLPPLFTPPHPVEACGARPWPGASPFPGQQAEMDGGGDPRSRAGSPPSWGPFVRWAAPPPPSPPPRTPGRAPGLVTFPGVENCISGL